MAITNMSTLFDKLQEYIDKKISGVHDDLEALFIEYGLMEIKPHLVEIDTVSNSIGSVNTVAYNIADVIEVANNMSSILLIPSQLDEMEQHVIDGQTVYDATVLIGDVSRQWAIEELNIPVNDGAHTGYSSYHWAKTAEATTYQLVLKGEWNPASGVYPAPAVHGDYYIVSNGGDFDGEYYYAGDSIIYQDNADATMWLHKYEAIDWSQVVNKPSVFPPEVHEHDGEYVRVDNTVIRSDGPADAGKVPRLGLLGQLHNSLIKLPVTYIVGGFTPIPTVEYPDTTGEDTGASWMVVGTHPQDGYSFFGGQLIGRTIRNGDFMIWTQEGWLIQYDKLGTESYLKRSGDYPMLGRLRMNNFAIQDVGPGVNGSDVVTVNQLKSASDIVFTKSEHIVHSSGPQDQGAPIVLNSHGLVDPSMVSFQSLIPQGAWIPEESLEYPPDEANYEPGYMWHFDSLGATGEYTFIAGDLAGQTADENDWLMYGQEEWYIIRVQLDPSQYYRLDGTLPLSADFNAGQKRIARMADGVSSDDAVSFGQFTVGMDQKAPQGHTHAPASIEPQGAGSGLDADKLDGLDSLDFMRADANINPGLIQPQGPDSGLDADTLDGKHAGDLFNKTDGVNWSDINLPPEGVSPIVKSSETIVGGLRIWATGDILNIATTDYVAP